jgi:tight adherence protein C
VNLSVGILLAFGAITVALVTANDFIVERRQVFKSLRRIRTMDLTPAEMRHRELSVPFFQRAALPALKRFGKIGRRFTPANVTDRLTKDLVYAGNPPGWDAERVLAFKVLGTVLFPVLGIVVAKMLEFSPFRSVVVILLMGFVGYYLPEWRLRSKAGKRQFQLQRALPDALDLLSITVEAGLGFDAAMSRVAKQSGGPLGEELHRVLREMQLGKSRSEALRDFGDRSNIPELKSFVLAMIQADVFGIAIGKVLHVQAAEMRLKRRQRAEEKAQQVPVKILFPLIFCIFPAMFIVILGPAAITIYQNILKK